MASVQYTQAHLDALTAAVASGEKSVSYDGKMVTYRSIDEINQVIAQIELWKHHDKYENKVYVLPKHLDEKVARLHLAKLGVKLDVLSPVQSEYLGIPVEGPYKGEHYRY